MAALAAAAAFAQPRWRDVGALERALNARDSATETLRIWCVNRRGAAEASIRAVREPVENPPPREVLEELGSPPAGAVRYRRVRLTCGGQTFSVADNWYRADRLTPAMNQTLDHSDKPFGPVVAPLGLHRHPLSSQRLDGRSGFVLARRAILTNDRGDPFSVVRERYTRTMVTRP